MLLTSGRRWPRCGATSFCEEAGRNYIVVAYRVMAQVRSHRFLWRGGPVDTAAFSSLADKGKTAVVADGRVEVGSRSWAWKVLEGSRAGHRRF